MAIGALASCVESREVTLRIRPPATVGDDAGAPAIEAALFREGPRCVALVAAPLDTYDSTVHVTAVRTRRVVAAGAPSCFGPSGSVLLRGLNTQGRYLVEMVVLDPDDWAMAPLDLRRARIVSLQDYPPQGSPDTTFICLSDPTSSPVFQPVLEAAVARCRAAPEGPPCTLDMPVGTVCPAGSR